MLRLLRLLAVVALVGPTLTVAQSLVLAGDLSADNAPVWNRMVELAVKAIHLISFFLIANNILI